jgi:hypothetical protein
MALDAAHRSSIYQNLVPILGEEDANILMSEFPSIEADELVTREFLRAELAELRTELHRELSRMRVWTVSTLLAGMALAATISTVAH